jgi:hypothetical protein
MMRVEAIACWLGALFLGWILSFCAGYSKGGELIFFASASLAIVLLFIYRGFYFWNRPRVRTPLPKLSDLDYGDIFQQIFRYELRPMLLLFSLLAIGVLYYGHEKHGVFLWRVIFSTEFLGCVGFYVGFHLLLQGIAILSIRRRFHTTIGRLYCWCSRPHDAMDGLFSAIYLFGVIILSIWFWDMTGRK